VGLLVLLLPVLRCPGCGRATRYFDNYSGWGARFTGDAYRHVNCRRCGCVIDRLTRSEVGRVPLDEVRILDRIVFLIRTALGLFLAGCSLVVCSTGVAIIIVQVMNEAGARRDRGALVLLGCGLVFLAGLASVAAAWWLKRKAWRLAAAHGVKMPKGIRIRW
jgi:hypothetical protein